MQSEKSLPAAMPSPGGLMIQTEEIEIRHCNFKEVVDQEQGLTEMNRKHASPGR